MFFLHTRCRACDRSIPVAPGIKAAPPEHKLIPVFDLGLQPLPNDFKDETQEHNGYAPLQVLFCPKCTLAQLSVVVRPDILYSGYPYVTSKSAMMRSHFGLLWNAINGECSPKTVIEIGSNDGDFLKFCAENGAERVCGIDPAENLSKNCGVRTIVGCFGDETARLAQCEVPHPDLIVARHVFCHVDDWRAFVRNLELLAAQDTLIVIEVPYVMDLLDKVEFDTIYHEHTSYLSIRAVQALLDDTGLRLCKIVRFQIHGGAIALMIGRRDSSRPVDESVAEFLKREASLDVNKWREFESNAQASLYALMNTVHELTAMGKSVCGFGASAKSTVWVNACKFTKKEIRFICDSTPTKQYKFSPGSNIPIVDEGALLREMPDFAVLFCWNFLTECIEKNQEYLNRGGKFLVPVPNLRIVSRDGKTEAYK